LIPHEATKATKKTEQESGDFEERSLFKKRRKSQEVDTESVYFLPVQDVKKWHNRCATTAHREEQARSESANHRWNIS
jgi:hypothetical protein